MSTARPPRTSAAPHAAHPQPNARAPNQNGPRGPRGPRQPHPHAHGQPHYKPARAPRHEAVPSKKPLYPSYEWASSAIAQQNAELELNDPTPDLPGHVSTFSGSSTFGDDNGPLKTAKYSQPTSIAAAPSGALFVAERRHRIRMISPDGVVSLFAGRNRPGYRDGACLQAEFSRPTGLCFTRDGHLLLCDSQNHCLRLIDLEAEVVSTYAGLNMAGNVDGHKSIARFLNPSSLCVSAKEDLFIADSGNDSIRMIDKDGIVSTLIGQKRTTTVPTPIFSFALLRPSSIACLPTGDLVIADGGAVGRVHTVSSDGVITPLGPAHERRFPTSNKSFHHFVGPAALCCASSGAIFLSETGTNTILVYNGNGFELFAGTGSRGCQNGFASNSAFNFPQGLALSPSGDLLVCDGDNHRIRKIAQAAQSVQTQPVHLKGLLEANIFGDFVFTHGPSHSQWHLMTRMLEISCPNLLKDSVKQELEALPVSKEALQLLFELSYSSSVSRPTHPLDLRALKVLCEVFVLAHRSGGDALAHALLTRRILPSVSALAQSALRVPASASCASCLLPIVHLISHSVNIFGYARRQVLSMTKDYAGLLVSAILAQIGSVLKEALSPVFVDLLKGERSSFYIEHDVVGSIAAEYLYLADQTDVMDMYTGARLEGNYSLLAHLQVLYAATLGRASPTSNHVPVDQPNYTLECEGEIFACHDWVLAGRWPFFARALAFGGVESHSRTLSLPQGSFSPQALRLFLKYIYTNTLLDESDGVDLQLSVDDCLSLLDSAKPFGIISLDSDTPVPGFEAFLFHILSILRKSPQEEHRGLASSLLTNLWWQQKWTCTG